MADVFECPSCSAPLQPNGAATTVTCPYCGDTDVVPPALRDPAPQMGAAAPTVVVQIPSTYRPTPRPAVAQTSGRGAGCAVAFALFMILATVGLPLYLARDEIFPQVAPPVTRPPSPTRVPTATPLPPFGEPVLTIDGTAAGPGAFKESMALALDAAGNIYLTDSKPGRVLKFSPQGQFVAASAIGDDYPNNLVADRSGTLYSTTSGQIRKYDGASGQLQDTLTWKDENFGFFGLDKVIVMADGSLLASLRYTDNLVRLDAQGKEIRRYSHPLKGHVQDNEKDLVPATDAQGNIYLLGRDTEMVYKLDPDGKFVSTVGTKGDAPGQLENAQSLVLDAAGRLYVSDSDGIEVYDPSGRYLGLIKTESYAYALAPAGDGQVVAAMREQAVKYRLNLNVIPTPPIVVGEAATPTALPTYTPLPSVGSTVTYEGWVISLGGAESRATIKLISENVTLEPDGRYVMIWVDARNQQATAHALDTDFRWHLQDENDRSYNPIPLTDIPAGRLLLRQEDRDALDADVAPKALTHPLLLFDVPPGAPGLQLIVDRKVGSGQVIFDLNLK